MIIFIDNINRLASDRQLYELFASFGIVTLAKVIKDSFTGQSYGFGFVEMERNAAARAIQQLNNCNFMQRFIVVNEADSKTANKHLR